MIEELNRTVVFAYISACGRSCNKVLRIPRNAANGIPRWELGRKGPSGNTSHLVTKYSCRIMQTRKDKFVRSCYEWEVRNSKLETCKVSLREEFYKTGLK